MGIGKIDIGLCRGRECSICVEDCPMDVLRIDEKTGKIKVSYPNDCHECYVCEMECPVNAIEVDPKIIRKVWFAY